MEATNALLIAPVINFANPPITMILEFRISLRLAANANSMVKPSERPNGPTLVTHQLKTPINGV